MLAASVTVAYLFKQANYIKYISLNTQLTVFDLPVFLEEQSLNPFEVINLFALPCVYERQALLL
jgi:hypothetical protein